MSGFEKPMISDRQREVVEIAKLKGVYQNLKKRGKEGALSFLQKHATAVIYLIGNEGRRGI
ncbi:MAG: hypothetical protein OSB25_12080 [Salibacteraceae bacterium]|nr:hypothetical protein [Salibacteraceae bacterium]|tara:strand:+ start:7407 stop:7589 length:183 start_codon:yes stop_codon:yes gene_type:complete